MNRRFRFVSDSLLFSACCIFLVSTLTPFIACNYLFQSWLWPEIRSFTATYWSYKAFSSTGDEVFLNDYWFNNDSPVLVDQLGISWVLVAIFILQVLTLTSIIISFFLRKIKKIRIIPFVSSVITILLMIQVYVKVDSVHLGFALATYQLGYWLNYLSSSLFLGALIFNLYSNR